MDELEENATSVSKGCFAYQGTHKRINEKDYYQAVADKFSTSRMQLFQELWETVHTDIEILRSDLNCQIFSDIISFLKSCHKQRVLSESDSLRPVNEVPTAILLTGVNTPDHDIMFTNLDSMLKSSVSPLVARLLSQDCTRTGAAINNMVAQILNVAPNFEDEDFHNSRTVEGQEDISQSPIKLKVTLKRKRVYNMTTLVKWYKKMYLKATTNVKSPKKKQKLNAEWNGFEGNEKSREHPLIVVMFEDVENIQPSAFQDFVSLCSTYLSSLPLVLVLGLATSITAMHQLLPSSISSLLCMEKFQAPPVSQYLGQLMEKIIMTPQTPFKLGPGVFHFLLDNFLYHDFSVLNFISGFEYCMLQHFLTNPLSALCCPVTQAEVTPALLSHAQLKAILKHDAFKSYLKTLPEEYQKRCQSDNSFLVKQLVQVLTTLHTNHALLFPALHFLHSVASELPKLPLGKQFRELYSMCLTEELCESEAYKQAFTYLGLMSLDDLSKTLKNALPALAAEEERKEIAAMKKDIEGFVYRLNHLDEEEEPNDSSHEKGSGEATRTLPQRTKLHELKERLQAMSSNRRKSPYEKLRQEILTSLNDYLHSLIKCPLNLPLHEALYFTDLASVKDQIKASPRSSVQKALVMPGLYLNNASCHGDVDAILPTMPDICILYKLHLECGTLVNLYDWLQAFVTVVSINDSVSKGRGTSKKKTISDELKARFIRGVSELQFLGFIKSTRRKTDHVTRLTW